MEDWQAVEPKDQDRIWQIALVLMSRSDITLTEALQSACAEFYGAEQALRRGLKFYIADHGEQRLRRIREVENGTWLNERARIPTPEEA